MVAPIISPWLVSTQRNNVKFVLVLWGITLVFLIVRNYIFIPTDEKQMLYYFGGYIGYFLLGYYLHRWRPRVKTILLIMFLILPFIIAVVLRMPLFSEIDRWSVLGYLSLFTALCSLAWFLLIYKMTIQLSTYSIFGRYRIKRGLIMISNLTFGVYLIHIPVQHALRQIPFVTAYGCVIELLLTIFLTFLVSLSIAYTISKWSFAQYVIGYKKIGNEETCFHSHTLS